MAKTPTARGWDPLVCLQMLWDADDLAHVHHFEYRDVTTAIVRYSAWRNRLYDVAAYHFATGATHISFKRLDRAAVRDWRHFQAIKNEVAGPEREAVELFPPESQLMDAANQYHLWVLPEGETMWLGMRAANGPELLPAFDTMDFATYRENAKAGARPGAPGGRQRAWEPDLPVGLGKERNDG